MVILNVNPKIKSFNFEGFLLFFKTKKVFLYENLLAINSL